MPLPFHPMYLEQLKAGYLTPYDGPGLPPGEGGPAPLQPGNQYGPTPFGVMGQYPPPGNQQDPLLGQPEQMETPPPQMGGIPPNPVGDPNQLEMYEQYGEPPPTPDYAAFDEETEAMARRIQKEGFYDMLIASGAGGMQALGGTLAQSMAGMARGVANLPSPRLAADEMMRERRAERRDMQSGFLSDRKGYYEGIQQGQKAEWIQDAQGGELNPWSGPGGSPFGAGLGAGASGQGSKSQMYKASAWSALREVIPEDKLPQAEALYMQGMATGDYGAYNDFSKANGFWGQDIANPQDGLMKIGQGGVVFDSIGNSYLIPSLAGNKWIRSEDISIPDPSALAQDQQMMDQVRLEISIANSIRRIVSNTATPDEIAKVTSGLSEERVLALQKVVELNQGGSGQQVSPEELHEYVYEWLNRSGYTSTLMRTGGLILRPGAMAYPDQGTIRQMRVSPTGQATPIATPARGVLPITGQDQGYREQGGSTFQPGGIEALDIQVAANGGPEAYYALIIEKGPPAGKEPKAWRKRLDKVFGERYGIGPQTTLYSMSRKDKDIPTPGLDTVLNYQGPRPNISEPDTLGQDERLAAEADRISAQVWEPKEWEPREGTRQKGELGERVDFGGIGRAITNTGDDAQVNALIEQATSGMTWLEARRFRALVEKQGDTNAQVRYLQAMR